MTDVLTDELAGLWIVDERGIQTLHEAATERLHQYWVHGKGAAEIGWGSAGDFDRCTHLLELHAHMSPEQAHGYCNLAHKSATGMYPATHAKLMGKHRSDEQIYMPTRDDLIRLVNDGLDPDAVARAVAKPYGDVKYADPGYLADGQPRYPIDAEHVMAAWTYINQADNAAKYTAEQLKAIKDRIRAAMKEHGHEVSSGRSALTFDQMLSLRYNEFHAPAGSSNGGQFASGGSSSGKSAGKKQAAKKVAHSSHASHAATKAAPHAAGSYAFDGKRGPGYGMKNGDPGVHSLQDDLVRLGFAHKGDKNLSDGKYGPKTSAAVKAAQKALGMKQDGIATPAFIAKLKAAKTLPHRSSALELCVRAFGFEWDERAAGDGRTLEGYAAVFNSPTKIRDVGGDFEETILPGAFSRSLKTRMPILQWDHGKDPRVGTVPIGAIQDLAEDSKGLHVRARLFDNNVVEPVRQAIEARAVRGMSFRFGVPKNGDEWPTRDKRNVRDADVHELGPVAFPAYDTTSVSVRSLLAQCDVDERRALIRELADELRQYVDLTDLTGRPDAWSDGGGEPGAEPDSTTAPPAQPHLRQRLDDGALRARGILK